MLSKCHFFLLWVCPFIQEMLPPFLHCLRLSFMMEELTSPSCFKQTTLLTPCRVDVVLYCYTQIIKNNQWIKWQNIDSCLHLQTIETRTRNWIFFSLCCSSVNQKAIEQFARYFKVLQLALEFEVWPVNLVCNWQSQMMMTEGSNFSIFVHILWESEENRRLTATVAIH